MGVERAPLRAHAGRLSVGGLTAGARVSSTVIVVPCFDEAERLQGDAFQRFVAEQPTVHFLLVDDGSRDATLDRLRALEKRDPTHFSVLALQPNRGKAEAVRRGMLEGFAREPDFVGFWDADLATPLAEIPRFAARLESDPALEIVFGSRVHLLGRRIQRSSARHYLGRVFATAASLTLGLPVYDTQCGAKLFRASPAMAALFAEPFVANWTFDVEIVARLQCARAASGGPGPGQVIFELPLERWTDVPGSKVRPWDFAVSLVEMLRIHRRYRSGRGR